MENRKIIVGRDKKCDLVVEDIPQNAKVSGLHATITEVVEEDAKNRAFVLEDHSTNGTYVNSKYVHNGTYIIYEGDNITLSRDYTLDWTLVLPFFGGRKTDRKPFNKETVIKPKTESISNKGFYSADPVYPDPLPIIDEDKEANSIESNQGETKMSSKKEFVFNGIHWLITIGAAIVGFAIGILVNH